MADAAITNSKAHAAGGNGEAISKLSKAGAADLPPAAAPSALQDAIKKLASAKAAAEMAAAVLAKVSGKVAKSRTAANNAEKKKRSCRMPTRPPRSWRLSRSGRSRSRPTSA